jgi:hypothetical protein
MKNGRALPGGGKERVKERNEEDEYVCCTLYSRMKIDYLNLLNHYKTETGKR